MGGEVVGRPGEVGAAEAAGGGGGAAVGADGAVGGFVVGGVEVFEEEGEDDGVVVWEGEVVGAGFEEVGGGAEAGEGGGLREDGLVGGELCGFGGLADGEGEEGAGEASGRVGEREG